jgi:predicted MPP superfamily phosphohydrolase
MDMLKTIILRFRDFGVDTFAVHQRLLEKQDRVWWAWWKKDTEPARDAEFRELNKLLSTSVVTIGIFNRAAERFFTASLYKVAYDGGKKMSCPAKYRTPRYIRDEAVPAWFELGDLKEINRKQFTTAFGGLPPSDNTFFPVVYASAPATEVKSHALSSTKQNTTHPANSAVDWVNVVYAPSSAAEIESAVLSDPIKPVAQLPNTVTEWVNVNGSVILHLSDLHFGKDFAFPELSSAQGKCLADIIVADIQKEGVSPAEVALVVISGDFTTQADANQFIPNVQPFLTDLAQRLDLRARQILVVPGNHDFPLGDFSRLDYKHEKTFLKFVADFYDIRDPSEIPLLWRFRLSNGVSVELLMINSVKLRDPSESDYGFVDWSLYEAVLAAVPTERSVKRIAVLHHHLIATASEELPNKDWTYGNVSVTLNAGKVIEGLQRHGFGLVLHGHQHIPGISRYARGLRPDKGLKITGLDHPLFILAAGTAGSKAERLHPDFPLNSYNILRLQPKAVEVSTRQFSSTGQSSQAWRCTLR